MIAARQPVWFAERLDCVIGEGRRPQAPIHDRVCSRSFIEQFETACDTGSAAVSSSPIWTTSRRSTTGMDLAGDDAIIAAADALAGCWARSLIARMGGDEFYAFVGSIRDVDALRTGQ